MSEWTIYRNDEAGFRLEHPDEWDILEEAAGSVVVVLAPEQGVEAFRANVSVATVDFGAPMPLEGFSAIQLETMGRVMTDARLIDREGITLLGRAGERVLVAYRQGVHSLALEQWWSVAGTADEGGAVVVSAVCAALDYDAYADTFSRVLGSLSLSVDGG